MKSKTFKRCIAIMLCMVIVLSGSGYLLAESLQEGTTAGTETEVQSEEGTTVEEEQNSTDEGTVEVDVPEDEEEQTQENAEAPAQEETPSETEEQVTETPTAETPAEEVESEEPILQLTYEDDKVKITVDAVEAGNIPNGATLSVTPIEKKEITSSMSADEKAKVEEINDQYDLTEQKLQEKAENETYDIAGFLAYDITFADANGNKLEPNGDVKVSMKYKQAEIPEEAKKVLTENDDQNLDVTVMHLEEDEKGEVKDVVDMVADENETATVETTSAMKVKKAEFVTDSFSVFTLTWQNNYGNSTLRVHLVDESGNEINSSQSDIQISESTVLQDVAPQINGYRYKKATLNSYTGTELNAVETDSQYHYYWWYTTKNNPDTWQRMGYDNSYDIYFVYENVSGLRITDDIVNTGALKAEYTAEDGEETVSGVSCTWYRSDSKDGTYAEVKKVDYQGNKSNISEDGSKVYPAFDNGAQKWYKVKATLADGTEIESVPVQVNYYDELKNGSFETPVGNAQWSNAYYKSNSGVWQTTGTGSGSKANCDIEIVNPSLNSGGYSDYSWYGGADAWKSAAREGSQFAELNCEAAGALYQDVLTMEGTPLNYWLSHRARGQYKGDPNQLQHDTMFLVIMPTSIAENKDRPLNTQAELEKYLSELGVSYQTNYSQTESDKVYNNTETGVMVLRVTSSNHEWQNISKTLDYTPTASLTRFFFMSGKTASGTNTVGNFLDRVGFSQELPPVSDDEFSIQIEKKFRGLGNDDISKIKNNIQFEISATKGGSELSEEEIVKLFGTRTISGANMSQMADGTLVYTIANRKIGVDDKYHVTVTEKNAEADGYKLESTAQTKVLVDGKESATIDDSQITELKGKVTATVTFTNSYEASNYKKVNFKKVWDDKDNAFNTRPDSLNVTLHASIVVEEDGETVEKSLDELTKTATLTSADAWSCSWDVPVYYEYNGVKVEINYSVTEGEINSDYVYQSPTDGIAVSGDGTDYTYTNFDNVKTSGDAANTTKGASVKNGIFNLSLQSVRLLASPLSVLSGEEESSLGQPAHNKYIAYNANTADYTLNLDVTGAKGDTPGVDVLFVIDTSGSMDDEYNWWGNKTKDGLLTTLKSLLTEQDGIIDKIFEKTGNVNSVAFVSFAGMSQTSATSWYQTSGKESFKQKINALKATGGTNWTYAMMKASEVLGQKSSSKNEKVVVFLSDGAPTFSVNSRGNETGNGSDTKNSYYTDAANKVSNSSSLKNAQMYSVYLTSGTQTGMKTFSDKLSNSELVNGTNLATALEEILSKVIPTYKNVVITDTLSEYVDFAESTPTITVTKKSAAGAETTLSSSEYTASVSGKTITVRLLGGASLEDGAKYTVSFRVKPSEAANNYFNTNSGAYPHTGEAGTGVTSAGQKGFYSNNSANTKVSYEIDGTEGTKTATYPKPVVQVTTHKLSYEKIWNQPDGIDIPDGAVELTVTYTDGTQNTVILNEANGYKTEETVSVTKNIASVIEKAIDGYTPSYDITDNGTKAVVTNSYSKVTSGSIEVVKTWEGNGPETPIRVSLWQQNTKDGTATRYKDVVTLSESNKWSYEWKDLPKEQGTGSEVIQYTYAVREENIPANYTSNITYSYGKDKTVATITNVYDSKCADENYYIANVLQTEQWTMNKSWQDSVDQSKRPDSLDVTVNDMTFRLTKDNWTKTVTVLKKKDATYKTSEDLSNDSYEQVEKVQNVTEAGMEVTFVNKLKLKSITVHKEWNDGNISTRPRSIQFKLLYRTGNTGDFTQYGNEIYTITEEDRDNGTTWSKVINDLPVTYEYKVKEVEAKGREGYLTEVTSEGNSFTITNTLKWSAKKVSEQWDGETVKNLEGAEFELKSGSTVIATGKSGSDGSIVWTLLQSGQNVDLQKLDGEYTIVETKAPEGYMIHEGGWTLTFSNGLLTMLDGKEVQGTATDGVVLSLSNKQLYELPETGGIGIFWYTIGGMLLMMAAALVLYKRKCREVLNK